MKLSIARWRPAHLFAAWGAYWAALAAATLTPAIIAITRVAPAKGNVSLSLGDQALKLRNRTPGSPRSSWVEKSEIEWAIVEDPNTTVT